MTFALSEGTPEARAHFTRGLLALHSFWYDEAIRQFDAAIAADPTMNMAYWGAALSRCKLLWGDDDIGAARALLSRMPNADGLGPRDRAWVLALIELLRADDVRTSRKKFAGAMETVYAQFPDDESATFLAIALLSATHPEDPDTIAVRKRVAALAIGVFEHNPKHPGAAHYLIHAYDTPELATLALPYAREYAKIAPAAFHARHMPAHIFSRLGMWQEAIASCQSAWDASVAAAARDKLSANHDDFHSLHWLVEMPFELGHRKDADAAMTTFANAVRGGVGRQYRALYANQVSSYMMRTGDWSRVEELLSPLDKPAVEDTDPMAPAAATRAGAPAAHCAPEPASWPFPLLEQVTILDARARASAAQHDLAKTKSYLAEIEALRQKLHPFFVATQKEALPKLEQTHTRHRLALLAQAARDDQALLKLQRQSAIADADQESSGGESNPSGFQSHDELADTLMRLERPKEAAAEYALALHSHPGRARSLLGGARAAKAMGDLPVAQKLYQQLLAQWSTADETTDGLAEARAAR
ncbi:MAG: tetratricopeptide repeat protein [Myxococcales bacterium]|nr:tetratricopeptide repeat protein [Myxococcales bacterium]